MAQPNPYMEEYWQSYTTARLFHFADLWATRMGFSPHPSRWSESLSRPPVVGVRP
jgi:hypothetical protein